MPTFNKGAKKSTKARNRRICDRARKTVEDRLTKQYGGGSGARKRAKAFMKGKQVHKTGRGYELLSPSDHGKKHGRGNRGKYKGYWRN